MTKIVLWVDDLDAAEQFYKLLLTAESSDKSAGFVRVYSSDNEVLLHLVPQEYRESNSGAVQIRENAAMKPVFSVNNIDATRARVADLAGTVFGPETEKGYAGFTYCDGYDTEGNVFQLSEKR